MELNGEQLEIVETKLKSFLPYSQLVYSYVFLRNRIHSDPVRILADRWPDFRVIICQPELQQDGDGFKDVCIFAKDEASLEETMKKANISWSAHRSWGVDNRYEETVKALALENNMHARKVAVCHMITLEDVSSLPPVPSGLEFGSLDESHLNLVSGSWKFSCEGSATMIRDMITHFPSCCVLDADRQPVAWILVYASGFMGMLYTLPQHRRRGLASALVSCMARRLHARGFPVYSSVEEGNWPSYRLFSSLGFTKDPSYPLAWFRVSSS